MLECSITKQCCGKWSSAASSAKQFYTVRMQVLFLFVPTQHPDRLIVCVSQCTCCKNMVITKKLQLLYASGEMTVDVIGP